MAQQHPRRNLLALKYRWLRWYATVCAWAAGFLFLWMLISPAIGPRGTKHTQEDFDTSSLFYLLPLVLHPFLTGLFWLSPHKGPRAHQYVAGLRLVLTVSASLAVITLISRVVTLKAYCRLKGLVPIASIDNRDPWKHCSSTRMASSAVVGTLYAIVAVVEIQALYQLEKLMRRHYCSSASSSSAAMQEKVDAWTALLGTCEYCVDRRVHDDRHNGGDGAELMESGRHPELAGPGPSHSLSEMVSSISDISRD